MVLDVPEGTACHDKASLVDKEVSDWIDAGCGCEEKNHYDELNKDALVSYVCGARELTKANLKQFVLGQHIAMILPAGDATEIRSYRYYVLSLRECKTVFVRVHGLGKYTMDSLKKLAAEGNPYLHVHRLKQLHAHNITPIHVREKDIQFIENYVSIYGLPQPRAPR